MAMFALFLIEGENLVSYAIRADTVKRYLSDTADL